ncbi:hypothetical protein FJZ21_02830 [Candidatus Pacearchaeota archaeon]|nr:hypothetical protein [Candidatus Pacearchaeota archaeon]
MLKIYSKVKTEQLIHVIWRRGEGEERKMNFMVPDEECLQAAAGVKFPHGHTFSGAHRHLPHQRITQKTQEAFIVTDGSVELTMYDLDNKIIGKEILNAGDCYVYLDGGHALKILSKEAFFYEIKNGPYLGRDKDKEFIAG